MPCATRARVGGTTCRADTPRCKQCVHRVRSSGPETSALAEDLIDALCGLLLLPSMPATVLWNVGWLLRQLLPASPGGGPRLTDQQCRLLESAMLLSRQFLVAELKGAPPNPSC